MIDIEIAGEVLTLLPEKGAFWKSHKSLIISDVHLGKAGHFRKHGIPITKRVHLHDLQRLNALIEAFEPARVLLLGDLFHSAENLEWIDFKRFLALHTSIEFILIRGNHDILERYPSALKLVEEYVKPPFSFTHERKKSDYYNISGHIHPGVGVKGLARQSITMPCFLFSRNYGVMPAFGNFTGIKKLRPRPTDSVFGIAEGQVLSLQ